MSTIFEQASFSAPRSESLQDSITNLSSFKTLADLDLQQFKNILNSNSSGLKLPDIFPQLLCFEHKPVSPAHPSVSDLTSAGIEATKTLYGGFKNALDAIKPEGCIQPYSIGNCYFVAALASLAKTNPEKIQNMIKVNDDGSYTVKFPGASSAITVEKPSADEIKQDGGENPQGQWALVLQKAYGKYCGGGKNDLDGSNGGSAFSAGLKILTEKGVVNAGLGYMMPLMTWKSMDEELRNSLTPKNPKDALPVTASTSKSLVSSTTADGFVRGHVYSVLDYKHNPEDVKQSKVTLRNPWGGKDATREITLQQFYANFVQLSVPRR